MLSGGFFFVWSQAITMTRILRLDVRDVRFPTSLGQHGSDAMNPDPDYSAAYVTLETDGPHQGNGIVFTLGRGTELCVAAVRSDATRWRSSPRVRGNGLRTLEVSAQRFAKATSTWAPVRAGRRSAPAFAG